MRLFWSKNGVYFEKNLEKKAWKKHNLGQPYQNGRQTNTFCAKSEQCAKNETARKKNKNVMQANIFCAKNEQGQNGMQTNTFCAKNEQA